MLLPGNLIFHNLYKSPDSDLTQGVIRFMSKLSLQKALTDRHFVVAASTDAGDVAAVSTFRKIQVPQLNNNYVFECQLHVAPGSGNDLYLQMLLKSIAFLNPTGSEGGVIGIMMIVQDKWMTGDELWRKAIWPEPQFVLMGFTKAGDAIYIHYFSGARI